MGATKAGPLAGPVKLFEVDDGGERFWYAALTAEAATDYHRTCCEGWSEEIDRVRECPPEELHAVGGDVEPGDVPPGGHWEASTGKAVGTTAQWLAGVVLTEECPVAPMWSTVY